MRSRPQSRTSRPIKAGTVRAVAVFAPQRFPGLPDVPTARELGVPFEMSFWWSVRVPGRTPPAIVDAIGQATIAAVHDPEMRKKMAEAGVTPVRSTREECEQFFRGQYDGWGGVLTGLGLTAK